MADNDIKINLTIEAQQVMDSLRQIADATAQTFTQSYSSAVDKVSQKLDELSRKQEQHKAVIQQNGDAVAALQQKKQTASEAEQKNIDAEINKLVQLTKARELDVLKIEESKAKLNEKAIAASDATDSEKLAMRFLTDARVTDLKALQDTIKAHNAVKDVSSDAYKKMQGDLAALTAEQEVNSKAIDAARQKMVELKNATGSKSDKDEAEQQIQSLQRSVAFRENEIIVLEAKKAKVQELAALSQATSEAEKDKIKQTTQEMLTQIATFGDISRAINSVKDAEDKASKSAIDGIYKVVEAQKVHHAAIAADEKQLAELEAKKQQASGAEEKQIDQQIASLKRIIAARKDDTLELDAKRIKLEETLALESSTSEKEEADIRKTTTARLAEIEILRDTARAQSAVGNAIDKSTNNLEKFMSQAAGLVGIASTIAVVQQAFAAIGRIISDDADRLAKMYEAAAHFRDENKDIYESIRPFYNQMGITSPTDQSKAADVLFGQIAPQTNLPQQTVVDTASGLAPYLKASGIGVGDKQFSDLVGTAGQFQYRGLDATLMGNFIGGQLKGNKGLTGSDVNQSLSNLIATAGSPQYANELMGSLQEQKAKAGAAGFGIEDMQKVWLAAGNAGVAPENRGAVSKQYFQSLDRWIGQSPEQLEQLYEKGNDFNPQQLAEIEALKKGHRTPAQMLKVMTGMQHGGTNLHSLDSFMLNEATTGQADIKQLAALTDQMDPTTKERFFRGEGGSRAPAAVMSVSGWQNIKLPTSAPTQFAAGAVQQGQAAQELAKYKAATQSPTSPGLASFQTQSSEIEKYLDANPMLKAGLYRPDSATGRLMPDGMKETLSGGATPKQQAMRMVLGDTYFALAQELQDMDDGKLPNDKTKRAAIENQMTTLAQALGLTGDQIRSSQIPLVALEKGKFGSATRSKVLDQYRDKYSRYEMFRDSLDFRTDKSPADTSPTPEWITPDTAGSMLDNAGRAARKVNPAWTPNAPSPVQGPPAPTSQPSAINYHIRNNNYGYSPDALGSVNQPANAYG